MRKVWGVVLAAVFCFALAGSARAQEITSGTIQGTVLDEKGATVPDAGVEIKNPDTNLTRDQNTGSDGRFVFLLVPSGRYTVTISKQGFTTLVQQDLDLTVGQVITLPMTMKVGATEQRVVVTATPTIETTETESSDTLNELTVATTPKLGRKFENLLTLTPGVSVVQGPDGDEINFNGQRGVYNNVSLDGGDYNNRFFGEQLGGQRPAIDISLDAVKEFQVVASGASAEFGRTAGGVINVVTKSGTNAVHGDAFYFQRLEALTAATSDGKSLTDFKREQFGGTISGPVVKNKMFFSGTGEGIKEHLVRGNLSTPLAGPACPEAAPVIPTNDADINANAECQRLALLNFFKSPASAVNPATAATFPALPAISQNEGLPVTHDVNNGAALGKFDWNVTPGNQFSASYNFDYSKNPNQTFDVPTYGNSANGLEGPSKIHAFNSNFVTTISATKLNEFHFTYDRELRPRAAAPGKVPDTAMGFVTNFRFGMPFFLEPTVDETLWHTDLHDNFSIIAGKHTIKFGGVWLHTRNTQIFRGFFTGRYIFDTADDFLHYAACSPTMTTACPAGFGPTAGGLLLYLQHGPTRTGESLDASGASSIKNEDYGLFIQDKWQIWRGVTFDYGLRWEAVIFPDPTVPPSQTAYGVNLSNPAFPSDGTIHNQKKEFQPRVGFAWDIANHHKSVLRASWGIFYAEQNMLAQVGAITTNGVQQQEIAAGSAFTPAAQLPVYPNTVPVMPLAPGTFPPGVGVTIFPKAYHNPRVYHTDVTFEQELSPNWAAYAYFAHAKGVHLTREVNPNVSGTANLGLVDPPGILATYSGPPPFPNLGGIVDTDSSAKSLYRGITIGMRKRLSQRFQMEGNYTYSRDLDDDSNERDPFTFRYVNFFNLKPEYSNSDRDERHKFNFFTFAELPGSFEANVLMQAHSAQPISVSPRASGGVDHGRNTLRKDNGFFSFDWRLARPFKFHDGRFALIPAIEMFNTFNNKNNVNPLVSPGLFNFDGFLRQGVGDPRQAQLSARFTW